jgi:hypothetical protein
VCIAGAIPLVSDQNVFETYPIEPVGGVLLDCECCCHIWRGLVALFEGSFQERQYSGMVRLCILPDACRPKRTERLLAPVGLDFATIFVKPDGEVVLQASKLLHGKLFLSGLKWALGEGEPLSGDTHACGANCHERSATNRLQYLLQNGGKEPAAAFFRRVGSIVALSGCLSVHSRAQEDNIWARLPAGRRPARECKFSAIGPYGQPISVHVDTEGCISCDCVGTFYSESAKIWFTGMIFLTAQNEASITDSLALSTLAQQAFRRARSKIYGMGKSWFKYPSLKPDLWIDVRDGKGEEISRICQFFNLHDTHDKDKITHTSFMGTGDILCGTGKWAFGDDAATQSELFAGVARLIDLGVPCFISERFTPAHPLAEDIDAVSEVLGSEDPAPTELILDQYGLFLTCRARILFELFPSLDSLELYVYNSSGWSPEKALHKISFHLIWPDVIVNHANAVAVRDVTIAEFTSLSDEGRALHGLLEEVKRHAPCKYAEREDSEIWSDEKIWSEIFDENSARPKNGLRMPYNFKADPPERGWRHKGNRSPEPMGIAAFCRASLTQTSDRGVSCKPEIVNPGLSTVEWLRRGSVRRPAGVEPTPMIQTPRERRTASKTQSTQLIPPPPQRPPPHITSAIPVKMPIQHPQRREAAGDVHGDVCNSVGFVASEAVSSTATATLPFAPSAPSWEKFWAPNGKGYWWWNKVDGTSFMEATPGLWRKYTDPDSCREYWWKSDNECFWAV